MTEFTERLQTSVADRYRIERHLGEGGMAMVYLAHDLKHDRKVALKMLRPELAAVIGAERFLAEIRTTANLQHPNILPLFDSGDADGLLFYVMPYVEGESLRDRLDREKQLPVDDALSIAVEVADALEYAHRRGVVHRDIKPENILLQDGRALVADFGIAFTISEVDARRLTGTGLSIGTPGYMSPEQAMGERMLDVRSDVFSLGVVLYEMVTGVRPFEGPTAQAIVANILTKSPIPPSRRRLDVRPELDVAILRALDNDRDRRTPSAEAFKDSLLVAAQSSGRRPTPRRTWLMAGLALGAIAGIAGVVTIASHPAASRRVAGSRSAPDTAAARLVKVADYWIAHRTQGGCEQAIPRYAEATTRDTSFAAAWAGLANANAICGLFGNADPFNGLVAARAAAEHALALDSGSAAAWTALGMAALFSEQAWDAARGDFERAARLDSTTPWPWLYRTWTFVAVGRLDSAEASIRQAYQRAPTANLISARLATILGFRGKYAEAQRVMADVLQRDSNDIPIRYGIVEIALRRNRCSDALAGADWLIAHHALEPVQSASAYRMNGAIVAAVWAKCGHVAEARRYADSVAVLEAAGAYVKPWTQVMVYAALGDSARMFTELETAVRNHDGAVFFLHTEALLAPYRDAPHFRDLMRRLHEL